MNSATSAKESAFGSRWNMYRLPFAAWAWHPELKEWEVYETDDKGVIMDLDDRYPTREMAEYAAKCVSEKAGKAWAE